MRFNSTVVGEGLAPPAETMPHFVRETEELVEIQDTSSVSLRLPPSPAGEGLGYARRNDAAYHSDAGDTRPKVGGIAPTVKKTNWPFIKGFEGL